MTPTFLPQDLVILKTDIEKLKRLVTGYKVTSKDITYEVSCATTVSWHYDYELEKALEGEKSAAGFGR